MINVITSFGHSFKGCGAYLGHDIEADTSERVAWTHTHNLATDDPEMASRIMAATAMSQADLKAEAGVKNTGRKSNKHVLHYVLSWHPEERGELTQDEMLAAALGSMSYIGTKEGERIGKSRTATRTQYLDEHQAVIYCHDEGGDKPLHVHVMANRVHPEHGVMVSDSKDYEKLSAWALDYRREQGKDQYCPERTKNAAKKAQGVLTSHPRIPRNVYETEQAIEAAAPGSRKKAQLESQRRREKELKTRAVQLKDRHAAKVRQLEEWHRDREKMVKAKTGHAIRGAVSQVRADYAPKIDQLTDKQASERQAFSDAKETVAGRVRNTWKALQTKEWMNDLRQSRISAVTEGFKLAFSSGLQEKQLDSFHRREQSQLRGSRTTAEREATQKLRGQEAARLDEQRTKFKEQRNDLLLAYDMEKAKLKAEWLELNRDRRAIESDDMAKPKTNPGQPLEVIDALSKRRNAIAEVLNENAEKEQLGPTPTPSSSRTEAIIDELEVAAKIKKMRKTHEQDNAPEREN